jgi:hypothetical protein
VIAGTTTYAKTQSTKAPAAIRSCGTTSSASPPAVPPTKRPLSSAALRRKLTVCHYRARPCLATAYPPMPPRSAECSRVGFAADSPLEGAGFELSVPRQRRPLHLELIGPPRSIFGAHRNLALKLCAAPERARLFSARKPEGESGRGQNAGITGAGTTCSSTPRTPGIDSAATRSACLFSPGSSSEIQK